MSGKLLKLGNKIKNLRKQLGISQQKLADILNISRVAVTELENNRRQVKTNELVKLANYFDVSTDSLLGLSKEPVVKLEKYKKKKTIRATIRINVPQRNIEKFKEVFLYIINKVGAKPNIGQAVIYKLLYYIDFNYYERYETQFMGATYIKNRYGPTPVEFKNIVSQLVKAKIVEEYKSKYFQYPQVKYLPLKKSDLSKLSANELEVIDDVLNKLSDMTAKQISDYSHNDVPWLTTNQGKAIEYESVFYRTPSYSVREDSEDI